MGVDNVFGHTVADGVARGHHKTLSSRYDKRYVGLRYPAGLRSSHQSGRNVFFWFTVHRPIYYRRWIAAAGFAAQGYRVSLFRLIRSFNTDVSRTDCAYNTLRLSYVLS